MLNETPRMQGGTDTDAAFGPGEDYVPGERRMVALFHDLARCFPDENHRLAVLDGALARYADRHKDRRPAIEFMLAELRDLPGVTEVDRTEAVISSTPSVPSSPRRWSDAG